MSAEMVQKRVGEFYLVQISQLDCHVVFETKYGADKTSRGHTMMEKGRTDPP